jgi:hypothetical protein
MSVCGCEVSQLSEPLNVIWLSDGRIVSRAYRAVKRGSENFYSVGSGEGQMTYILVTGDDDLARLAQALGLVTVHIP